MRTRVVIVGAVWLVGVIATWIYLASDRLHCQYFRDQTACARLEWQSALALAKKRTEARL